MREELLTVRLSTSERSETSPNTVRSTSPDLYLMEQLELLGHIENCSILLGWSKNGLIKGSNPVRISLDCPTVDTGVVIVITTLLLRPALLLLCL